MPTDAPRTRPHAALLNLLRTCHHSHAVTTLSSRSYGAVEASMPTGRHRGCPESSWSSESSVCCRSCCCGRLARPWRADACLYAALACRMMAYAGSGRCGVLFSPRAQTERAQSQKLRRGARRLSIGTAGIRASATVWHMYMTRPTPLGTTADKKNTARVPIPIQMLSEGV